MHRERNSAARVARGGACRREERPVRHVTLRISGGGFWADGPADLDDPEASAGDACFHASLHGSAGEVVLQDVEREDEHTLRATLAAGAPQGQWSLRVVDPRGREGTLPDALEILAQCASDADCGDPDACSDGADNDCNGTVDHAAR